MYWNKLLNKDSNNNINYFHLAWKEVSNRNEERLLDKRRKGKMEKYIDILKSILCTFILFHVDDVKIFQMEEQNTH